MEKIVSFIKEWFQEYRPESTLLNQILWIFWAVWVLLILIAVFRVIKFRLSLRKEKKIWGDGSGPQKTAVVIVPIKGVTPRHTSDFFQSLLEQNYAKYRIIVTVETSDDPAAEWLSDQFGISLSTPVWAPQNPTNGFQNLQLVVAGKCKGRGQKVHNQLAAFQELTPEDELIAFVDADILCPPDWLAKLTAPINRGTHDPATTYRWLVPANRRPASLFASVINASVTTQGGNVRENMPWGGSMAISRAAFNDLDVPALFEGSVNDDLRLGKAAKKAGYKVGYIRNLVRPSEINFTWAKFFEFARRQYLQVKVFAPILYASSNLIFAIYFWGFVSVVVSIAMGNLWAWVPFIIATLLDQVRASTRESIYRKLFGDDRETYKRIARTSFIEHFMTPVYMAIHGLVIMSTWFMNKMEWGGVQYQIEGVNKTRVLKRKPVEAVSHTAVGELALPAGGVFSGLAAINTAAFVGGGQQDTSAVEVVDSTVTMGETDSVEITETEEKPATPITEPIALRSKEPVPEEEPENEGSLLEDIGRNSALAVGATAIAAGTSALLANDDSDAEPEEEAGAEPAGAEEPFFTFQKLEPLVVEDTTAAIPVGATEFFVPPEAYSAGFITSEPAEEVAEEEPVSEDESDAIVSDELMAIPVGATEFFVSPELVTGGEAFADESEIGENAEPEIEEALDEEVLDESESDVESIEELAAGSVPEVPATAVAAIPQAMSAVSRLGAGGTWPSSSRMAKRQQVGYRRKPAGPRRIYLASRERLSRRELEKLKRAK
ncbi:MAG: glycosyltransferase family 2 protein [Verrucomicrobiales bacterium]|nr:glycosyltransferase family 2 protein [Verrucomicrobiales bacterium]